MTDQTHSTIQPAPQVKSAVSASPGAGLTAAAQSGSHTSAQGGSLPTATQGRGLPIASKGGSRVKKSSAGKTVAMALGIGLAVVLALAVVLGVWSAYGYEKVYPGVRVEGLSLQGLTRQETHDRVAALLGSRAPAHSFKLTVGEAAYTIEVGPQDLGYDAAATAELAWGYGRQGGFATRISDMWRALNGGYAVEPVFALRGERLLEQAEEIARDTQQTIVQGAYTFDGSKLIIDRGQAGTSVSAQELGAFILDKLSAGDYSDAVYPLIQQEPDSLDLLLIKQAVDSDYQEPRLDLENDPTGGTVIPAKTGVYMDLESAQRALAMSDERYVEIPVQITRPKYTTQEYQALLFRDLLGRGHTEFNAALKGRTTNVLLANGLVDGTILNPGDVFSYNGTVGPRTYERGFKDAIVYVGTSAEDGVGGGICQVSSTLYYACLRADLEIVERRSHSRMVTYVPLGEDATVAWGSTDYKFANNTDFPIKIVTSNTNNSITIELYGTQMTQGKEVKMETTRLSHTPFETRYVQDSTLPVGTEKVDQTGYTGYRTETWRVVTINGVEVSRTFENKSAYTKYDKVILHNPVTEPPATEPTVPAGGTEPPVTQPDTSQTEPPATDAANHFDETTEPTQPVVTQPVEPTTTEPEVTEPEVTAPSEE